MVKAGDERAQMAQNSNHCRNPISLETALKGQSQSHRCLCRNEQASVTAQVSLDFSTQTTLAKPEKEMFLVPWTPVNLTFPVEESDIQEVLHLPQWLMQNQPRHLLDLWAYHSRPYKILPQNKNYSFNGGRGLGECESQTAFALL